MSTHSRIYELAGSSSHSLDQDDDIAAVLLDAQAVMSNNTLVLETSTDDDGIDDDDDDDEDVLSVDDNDMDPFSPNFLVQKLTERAESPSELLQQNSHYSTDMTPTSYLNQLLLGDNEGSNLPPSTPCLDIKELREDENSNNSQGRMMNALMDALDESGLSNTSTIQPVTGQHEDTNSSDDLIMFSDSYEDEEAVDDDGESQHQGSSVDFETLMNQSARQTNQESAHSNTAGFDSLMQASLQEILDGTAAEKKASPKSEKTTPKTSPMQSPGGVRGLFQRLGGVVENALLTSVVDTFSPNRGLSPETALSDHHKETTEDDNKSGDHHNEEVVETIESNNLKSIFQNQTKPVEGAVEDDDAMSFVTAAEESTSPRRASQQLPLIPTLSKELTPKRSGSSSEVVALEEDDADTDELRDTVGVPVLVNPGLSPISEQPFIRMTAELEYYDNKDVGSLSSASTESSRHMLASSSVDQQSQPSRWIKRRSSANTSPASSFNPLHSIFNKVQQSSSGGPEVSPPGTPPEPLYEYSDNMDEDTQQQLSIPPLPPLTWEDISDETAADDSCSSSQQQPLPHNLSFTSLNNSKQASTNTRFSFSPNRRTSPAKLIQNFPEQLVAFSTLTGIDIPFRYKKPAPCLDSIGDILWKQLLARWKHDEMARGDIVSEAVKDGADEEEDEYSDGTIPQSLNIELELHGVALSSPTMTQPTISTNAPVSKYLSEFPSTPLSALPPYHAVEDSTIWNVASTLQDPLRRWIVSVVEFASYNNSAISYSVDLKDPEAVTRKAHEKYGDAVKYVKDVVRGQITFPDKSTLVCGLIQALRSTDEWEIVRIRNLFQSDSPTQLPTGYRHILLTLRWKENGCLAEIQLQLKDIFEVLGEEGYQLHRQIQQLESKCRHPTSNLVQSVLDGTAGDIWTEGVTLTPDEQSSNLSFRSISHPEPLLEDDTTESRQGADSVVQEAAPLVQQVQGSTGDVSQQPIEDTEESLDPVSFAESKTFHSSATERSFRSKPTKEEMEKATATFNIHLQELASFNVSRGDILLSLVECGARTVTKQARDIASYYCLHLLLRWFHHQDYKLLGFGVTKPTHLIDYSTRCLLRCLRISNQALSYGMAGWLEYGTSSPIELFASRPYGLLRQLACNYGRLDQWENAKSVLGSLVLHSRDHLGEDHPVSISALLDLAIAMSKQGGPADVAARTVTHAANLVSRYIASKEKLYWSHLSKCKGSKVVTFRIEDGRDAVWKLGQFCDSFRSLLLDRDMVQLAGEFHDVVLMNHCLVGDAFAILANCKSAAHSVLGLSEKEHRRTDHKSEWRIAMHHYEHAFLRFLQGGKALNDPLVSRTVYGLARCLRELGETKKALELLTLVVSCNDQLDNEPVESTTRQEARRFLPTPTKTQSFIKRKDEALQSSAMCLWLMAILALEESTDEAGRNKAFDLLHAASINLQDTSDRSSFIPFLAMIEEEAVQIAEHTFE